MKRIIVCLLAIMMVVSFAGCSSASVGSMAPDQIAEKLMSDYQLSDGTLYRSTSTTVGEYLDEDLIQGYYGSVTGAPDFSKVESYAVYIDETNPTSPKEFGIFKMKNADDAKELAEYIVARISMKMTNAMAYPSVDISMLEESEISVTNNYVSYVAVNAEKNKEIDKFISNNLK